MYIVLAIELVQDAGVDVVRGVFDDLLAPFDGSEDLSSFLPVQDSRSFEGHDICI